jgi:hypothetical protein
MKRKFIEGEEYLDMELCEIVIYQSKSLTKGHSVFIEKPTNTVMTRPDKYVIEIPYAIKPTEKSKA